MSRSTGSRAEISTCDTIFVHIFSTLRKLPIKSSLSSSIVLNQSLVKPNITRPDLSLYSNIYILQIVILWGRFVGVVGDESSK